MTDDPEDVARITDPAERARMAGEQVQRHQRLMNEFARLRREAIEEMRSQGLSYAAVAEALGVSRARVAQLRAAGPPPERALLGTGTLTIAIPSRAVPGRDLPVVAAEDMRAAEELAALARSVGLDATVVHIPPDGAIDFDVEDLAVICGPKNSPDARRLLDNNPQLDIREADDGTWVIEDRTTGDVLASPLDHDPKSNVDIAYVARVPRPAGEGSALHIAGIHAIGSLGAVRYLAEHLGEVYGEVQDADFSMVVESRADKQLQITKADVIVAPRRH
jgi:hypothetical protein